MANGAQLKPFNALVLAGSRDHGDLLAQHIGIAEKALIEIGDRTMLERVVSAVRHAGADRLAVAASAGPVTDLARRLNCEIVPAQSGPSDSAGAGFATLGAPMLLTTADNALLQPAWIIDFIARVAPDADVCVLLARRETIERAAPGVKRTYLRFADGDWSGCNLFYFATTRSIAAIEMWKQVEADRKQPWRIVRRLGFSLLLRYLLGRLTLAEAIAHLGSKAGLTVAIVESGEGLAAVDVDKPEDLQIARFFAR